MCLVPYVELQGSSCVVASRIFKPVECQHIRRLGEDLLVQVLHPLLMDGFAWDRSNLLLTRVGIYIHVDVAVRCLEL